MSLNAIVYDSTSGQFDFNGVLVDTAELISKAEQVEREPVQYRNVRTASGKRSRRKVGRFATIGQISITANYIRSMLKFVKQHNWFVDHTDINCGDHSFDPNVPTPGSNWGRANKLKTNALQLIGSADQVALVDTRAAQLLRDRAGVLLRESGRLRSGRRPRKLA